MSSREPEHGKALTEKGERMKRRDKQELRDAENEERATGKTAVAT